MSYTVSTGNEFWIKRLDGSAITLEGSIYDTVLEVKKKIFLKEGIPVENQRLVYAGKQLQNNKTLKKSGLSTLDGILLIVRKPGGSRQKIWIKSSEGLNFTIYFNPEDTVVDVKKKIYESKEIPIKLQRLFVNTEELENTKTLREYRIEENTTIDLRI